MMQVIEAYYSYYDELKRNPDLGLSLYSSMPDLDSEMKWYADLMGSSSSVAVVGEADGRVVGLCTVEPKKGAGSHVGVLGIAIMEKYRNRGIGRKMLTMALELARDKFEIVTLSVFSNNLPAIHLYRSLGFIEYGLLPKGLKRDGRYFDEVLMYRQAQA